MMTDNEIIKALECHASHTDECDNCPNIEIISSGCSEIMAENALALINRQKAEIERLKNHFMYAETHNSRIFEIGAEHAIVQAIKPQIIREFVERLKERRIGKFVFITTDRLDGLIKEMTED